MNKKGMLQPGQKIILSGFGAGLTWGAAQIEVDRGKAKEKNTGATETWIRRVPLLFFILRG